MLKQIAVMLRMLFTMKKMSKFFAKSLTKYA